MFEKRQTAFNGIPSVACSLMVIRLAGAVGGTILLKDHSTAVGLVLVGGVPFLYWLMWAPV